MKVYLNQRLPEKGELWLDEHHVPRLVTHVTGFSVTFTKRGHSDNMRLDEWLNSMSLLDIEEELEIEEEAEETEEDRAELRGEYWMECERNGDFK